MDLKSEYLALVRHTIQSVVARLLVCVTILLLGQRKRVCMLPLQVMCIKLPDFADCYIMIHLTNFKDTWMTCPKCYVSHGIIQQVYLNNFESCKSI